MAQCFNPCGSIIGMFVAMNFIQARLNPMSSDERALLGGSVLPPLQAMIIDQGTVFGSFPATNLSFILPLVCFTVVTAYGYKMHRSRGL